MIAKGVCSKDNWLATLKKRGLSFFFFFAPNIHSGCLICTPEVLPPHIALPLILDLLLDTNTWFNFPIKDIPATLPNHKECVVGWFLFCFEKNIIFLKHYTTDLHHLS